MALFSRQLPNRARPGGSAYLNSKLSHLVNQGSSRHSQPNGRPVLSSDQPVGLVQCFQDMLPIGVGQRACSALRVLLHRVLQVQRQAQHRPGENSTARSMKFWSSRILPGQLCASRTVITSSGMKSMGLLRPAANFATKNSVRGGMTNCPRSWLVAATTRTLTRTVWVLITYQAHQPAAAAWPFSSADCRMGRALVDRRISIPSFRIL